VAIPVQAEQDSGVKANSNPKARRTGFRREAEHRFRSEAEQFSTNPGIVFDMSPEQKIWRSALDITR